jgi:pimeloyl-ACP methyl ester carboxylesterase
VTPGQEKTALVLLSPYGQGLWREVRAAMGADRQSLCLQLGRGDSVFDLAVQALADCPPRFCVAGFCLGGAVAIEICGLAGDRVHGLALINASLAPDGEGQRQARRQRIDKLREKVRGGQRPDAAYLDHAARWLVAPGAERAEFRARDILAVVPVARSLVHQKALLSRPDPRPALAAIPTPVLAISGDHDRICPPVKAGDLPSGAAHAAHLLPGCGHLSPLERPEAVAALLGDWLERIENPHPTRKGEEREPAS